MRNIALKIAYQGQNFVGWQCQPIGRTVEGELRKVLVRLHKRTTLHEIPLYGAGRTDSGVHATGQVANFYSDINSSSLPAQCFREAINSLLPKDIRILQSWEAPGNFHARYSARRRIYHYRITQSRACPPEQRQNAWYLRSPRLDIAILNCMVAPLIGEHDFSNFTVARDQTKTKIRHIYAISFYVEGSYIVFRIVGNAFLWHMVRRIVGTTIGLYSQYLKQLSKSNNSVTQPYEPYEELYTQRYELRKQMELYLQNKARLYCQLGHEIAPAHGLTLNEVIYSSNGQFDVVQDITHDENFTSV